METGIHIGTTSEDLKGVGEIIIEILKLDQSDYIKEAALQALSKVAKVEHVTVAGSKIIGDKNITFEAEEE